MVVCKFFQQGHCRYGQNCRFEHIYGSKYSYHANPPSQAPSNQAGNVVTDEQLVNQVQSDIQAALRGGQWIVSCYAPFKEKPQFPGMLDLSPEEARLFIYEAKINNTVDQAVAYINNVFKQSTYKYEHLLQPTVDTIKILRSLYKGESVTTTPTQTPALGTASNASSIFRSALNNTNTSIFNQNTNQSIFGQSSENTVAKSIFAQATHAAFGPTSPSFFPVTSKESSPNSIFAQENQKIFGQTPANNPNNIFASASQNFFGKSNEQFGQSTNAFTNQLPMNIFKNSDVFQKSTEQQNVFGGASVFEQKLSTAEDDVYSKIDDLSQEDLEAFKSNEFKLGFVPELPPPQALCT